MPTWTGGGGFEREQVRVRVCGGGGWLAHGDLAAGRIPLGERKITVKPVQRAVFRRT